MDTKELLNIYNRLSNEDLINLFEMSSKRIFVWNPNDKTCYELDNDVPCCFNGTKIQVNIAEDGMILKPMLTKE
jgi:hypothetical protein|tara:strand:+ start:562 stop:783 length:222 start_codon:yes stop_codon:yes gene_type:complete